MELMNLYFCLVFCSFPLVLNGSCTYILMTLERLKRRNYSEPLKNELDYTMKVYVVHFFRSLRARLNPWPLYIAQLEIRFITTINWIIKSLLSPSLSHSVPSVLSRSCLFLIDGRCDLVWTGVCSSWGLHEIVKWGLRPRTLYTLYYRWTHSIAYHCNYKTRGAT